MAMLIGPFDETLLGFTVAMFWAGYKLMFRRAASQKPASEA